MLVLIGAVVTDSIFRLTGFFWNKQKILFHFLLAENASYDYEYFVFAL